MFPTHYMLLYISQMLHIGEDILKQLKHRSYTGLNLLHIAVTADNKLFYITEEEYLSSDYINTQINFCIFFHIHIHNFETEIYANIRNTNIK